MKKRFVLIGMMVLLQGPAWAGRNSSVRFGIGPELQVSPGYHSFLNDAYDDVTGAGAWLGIKMGLACKINERWTVQPQVTGFATVLTLSTPGSSGDSQSVNTLAVPAIAVRYFPFPSAKAEWTLSGEINKAIPSTDLVGVTLSSSGVGAGFNTGVRFHKRFGLELGYTYYPVKATANPNSYGGPVRRVDKTYDFGGVSLGFMFEF